MDRGATRLTALSLQGHGIRRDDVVVFRARSQLEKNAFVVAEVDGSTDIGTCEADHRLHRLPQ